MMNKPKRHPDVEHIAQCAEETKKRFRELSQPSKAVTTEDHDPEDTSTTQQRSVFQKFVGYVVNLNSGRILSLKVGHDLPLLSMYTRVMYVPQVCEELPWLVLGSMLILGRVYIVYQ